MQDAKRVTRCFFVAWLLFCAGGAALAHDEEFAAAQRLLLMGRYAEAGAAYGKLADEHPAEAALGAARCRAAEGNYDDAATILIETLKDHANVASLRAELAELAFQRGDYEQAGKQVELAIKLDPDQLQARWVKAELFRTAGDLKAAEEAYEWFVDYYNRTDRVEHAEDIRTIALAAAQFARWNRLSDQFGFIVNELLPGALSLDERYWPAHLESALLFLEKYNQAEAKKSIEAGLAINPNAAALHAAAAELAIQSYELEGAQRSVRQALSINPKHLRAILMRADIHLANFEPDAAIGMLEAAQKLNPMSEETLGRLAAGYGMVDGLTHDPADTRMGTLIDEVRARNPHCGTFFFAMGEALDKGRKYPHAAKYYAAAVEAMPQFVGSRGQLGLMYMRLGEEDKAREILSESFDIDPFNVRVSNSLKVLEVLEEYETVETEHFVIRFDGKKDKILAKYAAEYLEAVYPELCRRLAFEPPEKSLFEIFNRAKNTDGHGWFSARMVGLPQIHTIGACAGKMVALTSPTSMPKTFNWARVLKHEFVHVINLQQTNFNIPHWFTEALAVLLEDGPRPPEWDEMLARRVPAGERFNLDTINMGFIRPTTSEDWQMAYCQAEIYAEYMVDAFGQESLGKMLAAYRDNLNTRHAIERALGVSQEEFEREYTEHLQKIVRGLTPGKKASKSKSFAELVRAAADDPENADLAADLALAYLERNKLSDAGQAADRALEIAPKHQLAGYVKARLLLKIGEAEVAEQKLVACLDRENPRPEILKLLAGLRYRDKDYTAAEELFLLGRKHASGDLAWTKSLAMVYLRQGNDAKLADALRRLADADYDDLTVRKKLAELALEAEDYAAAEKWANQCVWIDVMDSSVHRLLAKALSAQEKHAAAAREYETLVELEPNDAEARLALAEAWIKAKEPEKAKGLLEKLVRESPNLTAAKTLLESLTK